MNLQKSAGNVKVEPDHFAITHQHDDAIVISSSDEDTESDMECSSQQPFKTTLRRIIRPRILTKTTPGGGCHKIWITDESDDNEQYELQDNADEIDTERRYGLEDNSDADDESSLSSLHSDKFEEHGWFSNSSDNNDSDRDMDFDFPSGSYESDNGSDDHSSDLDIVNDTSSDTNMDFHNAPRSGDGYESDQSSLPDLVNDTSSDSNMDFHNAPPSDDHSSDIDLVNDTSSDNDTADSIPPNRLLCISSQGVIKLQVMDNV